MTFKAAIQLKAELSSTFKADGIVYKVFVTPESNDDLLNYLRDIRAFFCQLKDNEAKKYSKNGKFAVHGLCYEYKGLNILCKPIEVFSV
jgi:hypothetical protein